MFRGWRPPAWFVQRDIQIVVRSFPGEFVDIVRPRQIDQTEYLEPEDSLDKVFSGEALVVPEGAEVARYGLGQVEEDSPKLLVPGFQDIRLGDLVYRRRAMPGGGLTEPRRYRVQNEPTPWHAFTLVTLTNFGQVIDEGTSL